MNSEMKERDEEDVHLNWPKIIVIGLIPIIIIFALFFWFMKQVGTDNYMFIVNNVEQHFGLAGIFLYVFLVDLLILPLSPDFVFPIVAGMPWYEVIPIIGTASALGGVIAYFIGRFLCKVPVIDRLADKAKAKWGKYINKYGIVFVILSALTPIPFSTVCVAAGVTKLSSKKVIPCCFFRILRMALYFFLFKAGFLLA